MTSRLPRLPLWPSFPFTPERKVFAGVLLILAVCLGLALYDVHRLHTLAAGAGLQVDSLQAAHDPTQSLGVVGVDTHGDTIAAWRRRSIQEAQRADSLDRALRQTRSVALAATATVAALVRTVQGLQTSAAADSVKRAHFAVRQAPYTYTADVTIAPPPTPPTAAVSITLDPIPLGVRLTCGARGSGGAAGIRPASVLVTAPSWATIALDSVSQDPAICGNDPAAVGRAQRLFSRVSFGVAAGYGLSAAPGDDGRVRRGWAIVLGPQLRF